MYVWCVLVYVWFKFALCLFSMWFMFCLCLEYAWLRPDAVLVNVGFIFGVWLV